MTSTSGPRRRVLLHLAAMGAVLAVALGVVAHQAPPAHAELTPDSGLLVSTRDQFRMCVDVGAGVRDPARARADLVAGLARVQRHPDWTAAFGAAPASAAAALAPSCPQVRLPAHLDRTTMVGPGLTADPSPYRTWVHVLDDATADRLLGEHTPARVLTAEAMRDGLHQAAAVSTALLVRRDALDDAGFRRGPLTEAIGRQPTVRVPATAR